VLTKTFSEKYKVTSKRDDCGEVVINGSRGHIYDGFDDDRLGLFVGCETVRKYTSVRKVLEAAGFTPKQIGSTEGCFTFNSRDARQAKLALKTIGARRRREAKPPTAAQLEARAAFANRRRRVKEVVLMA
jgi:hypothetical protein